MEHKTKARNKPGLQRIKTATTALILAACALFTGCKSKHALEPAKPLQTTTKTTACTQQQDTIHAILAEAKTETYTYDSLGRLATKTTRKITHTINTTKINSKLSDSTTINSQRTTAGKQQTNRAAARSKSTQETKTAKNIPNNHYVILIMLLALAAAAYIRGLLH